ncbi:MAG TPA: hypothetical protein VLE49_09990, partial [Anaerolineales bacterium]|nr:hypothetical protein [Anaerolineales bacterium]
MSILLTLLLISSFISVDDGSGELSQCHPLGTLGQAPQRLQSALDEATRHLHRRRDRSTGVDLGCQPLELRNPERPALEEEAQPRVVGMSLEVDERRQGQDALLQILPGWLPQAGSFAGEVEHIIHD